MLETVRGKCRGFFEIRKCDGRRWCKERRKDVFDVVAKKLNLGTALKIYRNDPDVEGLQIWSVAEWTPVVGENVYELTRYWAVCTTSSLQRLSMCMRCIQTRLVIFHRLISTKVIMGMPWSKVVKAEDCGLSRGASHLMRTLFWSSKSLAI